VSDAPQRVFITGASSGIGEALARHYAGNGARLGLVARRADRLEALIQSLPGAHTHLSLPANVQDSAQMRSAAERFVREAGVPDIVIANAGVSVGTLTEEADDLQAFEAVFQTNVMGMVHSFQPFVSAMRAQRRGTLVGISSVAGVRGLPGAGAYSASKAAVSRYLESLRVELRDTGVRVVNIRPGYIATPMTAVNPYAMPFILQPSQAAIRFARAIERGASLATIPWQMGVVARLLAVMPDFAYDAVFSRAQRKPRHLPL
jgi:NADP-dependent 3-hydroxy acid dehydrogenase YdfG